jgi:hypothetical protein
MSATRRTKRRYAHELYPAGGEWEIRSLNVEVPRLYARAMGLEVEGTGWFKLLDSQETAREASDRTMRLIDARRLAFMADAMAQGLTGDDAWGWAARQATDESGELAWERAEHYGVDPNAIKPYPCGPEPIDHDHYSHGTHGVVTRIPLRESECHDCTEPIEDGDS